MGIEVKRENVKGILKSAGSRMISVRFYKKGGEERKLTGQLKVKKYLKGGVNSLAGKEDLVTIYDVNAKGYRSFDINRLIEIKCNGITYNVVDGFVEEEEEGHRGYVLHDLGKEGFLNTTSGCLYKITGVREDLSNPSKESHCYEIIDDSGEYEIVMTGNQFVYTQIPADSQGLVSFENEKAFNAIAGSSQWVRFCSDGILPLFDPDGTPRLYYSDAGGNEIIQTSKSKEELIEEFEASLEKFSRKFVEEIRKSFYKILDETSI